MNMIDRTDETIVDLRIRLNFFPSISSLLLIFDNGCLKRQMEKYNNKYEAANNNLTS